MSGEIVLYYHAALHHEFDMFEFVDISEWVAGDRDDIRVVVRLD